MRAVLPLGLAALAAFAATSLVAACADETIVLATLPTTDAGSAAPPPTRCVTSGDCASGYYCSMTACGAQTGTCTLPPVVCDPTESPVCGCDNITYFNDCLRQSNGAAASTDGPCMTSPLLCGGPANAGCPAPALCAQLGLSHGPCDDVPGTCWVVPAHCPSTPPPDLWDSCDPEGSQCLDTCSAITKGGAYRRSERCP
jgi:hypothetical protein